MSKETRTKIPAGVTRVRNAATGEIKEFEPTLDEQVAEALKKLNPNNKKLISELSGMFHLSDQRVFTEIEADGYESFVDNFFVASKVKP